MIDRTTGRIPQRNQAKRTQSRKSSAQRPRETSLLGKLIFRFVITVAVVVISGFGASKGYEAAVDQHYFDVKEIIIAGHNTVKKETIAELMGPTLGKNIFTLDLMRMGKNLESYPWIEKVEIRRDLPSTITVRVKERQPAAILSAGGASWVVDTGGAIIRQIAAGEDLGLPALTGIKVNAEKIKPGMVLDISSLKPAFDAIAMVSEYRLLGKNPVLGVDLSVKDQLGVFFRDSEARVILPRQGWTDEMDRLKTVDHILRNKGEQFQTINLMFPDKVIVTNSRTVASAGTDKR